MREAIKQRLGLAREMVQRPWFRTVLVIWAAISIWDTFISQFLPEKLAADAPRVYKIFFWLLEMTSGWLSFSAWLLIGAAIIVIGSIEFAFRLTREEQIRQRYLQPAHNLEKDRLDYLVEGMQAVNDITNALNASTKDTTRIGKILNRYAIIVPFIKNMKLKRRVLSRAASHINLYSDKVHRTAEFIGAVTPVATENQIKFIEGSVLNSDQDKANLKNFITVVESTSQTVIPTTVKSFEDMRIAAGSIKGVTGDLNAASSRLYVVVGTLIEKINGFGIACEQMRAAALKKLEPIEVMK